MRKGSTSSLKREHSGNVKPTDATTATTAPAATGSSYRSVSADYPLDSNDSDHSTLHIPHSASTISGDVPVEQYYDFQHHHQNRQHHNPHDRPVDTSGHRQMSLDVNPNDHHPSPPSTSYSNPTRTKSDTANAPNRESRSSRQFGPTAGLAPFKLLSKSTTAGNFTLANILNTEGDEDRTSSDDSELKAMHDLDGVDEQSDPVCLGILNVATAQSLFDKYVSNQYSPS